MVEPPTAAGSLPRWKEWFASRAVRIPSSYAGPSKDNPFLKELTSEHFDTPSAQWIARFANSAFVA